jgi:hypothetical protein
MVWLSAIAEEIIGSPALSLDMLAPCRPYPENLQLGVSQSNASQMQAVATEAFQSVDAHTPQYVLKLKTPATKKVRQSSRSDVGVDPLG